MDTTTPATESSPLATKLAEYNEDRDAYKLIEGEFKVGKDKTDEIIEKVKADIFSLAPNARDMAEALMMAAESETVRWNIAKWVLEFTIKGGADEDEMSRLFASIKKKPE